MAEHQGVKAKRKKGNESNRRQSKRNIKVTLTGQQKKNHPTMLVNKGSKVNQSTGRFSGINATSETKPEES